MASIIRLQPRAVIPPLCRFAPIQRTYAQTPNKAEDEQTAPNQNTDPSNESHDNYPIPSNKAHPTLRDGKQSPMADTDGHLRSDLPEDVKQHNAEVEQRYDRPYNHIADEGSIGHTWEKK